MDAYHAKLIEMAKTRMRASNDPVHDYEHVCRVVDNVSTFSDGVTLTPTETRALTIATWWHDVSRTITKNPFVLGMSLVDDFISGIMLWWTVRKTPQKKDPVLRMAVRILLSRNLGLTNLLPIFFFSKRQRVMLHILADADNVDILHIKRVQKMLGVAGRSRSDRWSYSFIIWWISHTNELRMHTKAGAKQLRETIEKLIEWMYSNAQVVVMHLQLCGHEWVDLTRSRILRIANKFAPQLFHTKFAHLRGKVS